jgi:SAM-dependent methyltransferase
MLDPTSLRYEAVPYNNGAISDTHPARLCAIGRLHGLPTAAADHCRVLELGCAEGMNLLPLAERFPASQFVGIDFSAKAIAVAESAAAECDLRNIRFECRDLREFISEAGSFDYLLAHGVYSWVSDEVKDRLLAICRAALAPGGLAYVSYNTLPGCAFSSGLRSFLLEEIERAGEPGAQLEHARKVLTSLAAALPGQPGGYATLLRETIADLLQKAPAHLYHDDLEPVNDPCTFTAFVSHAAAHELYYLAEAHYATMHFAHAPPAMRAPNEALDLDFLRTQQFMDVLFERRLRNSLLSRAPVPPARPPFLAAITECALGLRLRPESSSVDLRPGVKLRFFGPNDLVVDFAHPAEKAFLAALVQAAPMRLPYATVLATTGEWLSQAGLPKADHDALCALTYRLFSLDALDLVSSGDGCWLHTDESPAPSPLMRLQARRGAIVTNRWHEPISLTAEARAWVSDPAPVFNPAAKQAGLLV